MNIKEILKQLLQEARFTEKYAEICNSHNDYSNGMNFTRKEVAGVLSGLGFDLKYEPKDKSFFNEYVLDSWRVNIAVTYKYGFVECFYTFSSNVSQERVRGRFNSVALVQDEDFKNKVAHSFPIATSLNDLQSILKGIMELHNNLLTNLKNLQVAG